MTLKSKSYFHLPIKSGQKSVTDLSQLISHVRDREYMSGIERDQIRVKATSEVFTPTQQVQNSLDRLPIDYFKDPTKTFLDNSCGDGQFLGEILIRKVQNGISFETALQTIYGVDLMPDNVELCRERLLCGQEHLRPVVEQNIICADALRYHYRFDGSDPYEQDSDRHFKNLFQV